MEKIAKVLGYDLKVSEFESQLHYFVHFQIKYALEKYETPYPLI